MYVLLTTNVASDLVIFHIYYVYIVLTVSDIIESCHAPPPMLHAIL